MEKYGIIDPAVTPDVDGVASTKQAAAMSEDAVIRELDCDLTRRLADTVEETFRKGEVSSD